MEENKEVLTPSHQFKSLPEEVRFKIWTLSCTAQVHHLRYNQDAHAIVSSGTPPSITQVCSESRQVATKVYRILSSSPHDDTPQHRWNHIQSFYFHPALDTLFLDYELQKRFSGTFFSRFPGSFIADKIANGDLRRIALDHRAWLWIYDWHSVGGLLREDSWLRALDTVCLVTVTVGGEQRVEDICKLRGTWRFDDNEQQLEWETAKPLSSKTAGSENGLRHPSVRAVTLICDEDTSKYKRPVRKSVQPQKKPEKKKLSRFLSWSYIDKKVTENRFLSAHSGVALFHTAPTKATGVYAMGDEHISKQ